MSTELLDWIDRGGPLMWPLLACSVVALAIIVERLIALRRAVLFPKGLHQVLKSYLLNRDYESLLRECVESHSPLGRIVATLVQERRLNREDLKDILWEKGREELPAMQKRLNILGSIATVSPLLGLLGTVLGMIRVFGVISQQGLESGNLSQGISQALLTTATGLSIAIPALVFYQLFSGRVVALAQQLEQEGLMVIRLLKPYQPSDEPGGRESGR